MTMSSSFQSPTRMPSPKDRIVPVISDDECMSRLAHAVAEHDDRRLTEVAQLIGRLAVPIE